MAKIAWTFVNDNASTDFTSSVQNFTYTQGRRSVLDTYAGGTAQITMRNNTGQVAGAFLGYRQKVLIKAAGVNAFIGWVQGIDYNDTPGNANDATATITLGDAWVLAGQQIAVSQAILSAGFQVTEIGAYQFYTGQFDQDFQSSNMQLSAGYSGDWNTRLNQIVSSDRGRFSTQAGLHDYVPFTAMDNLNTTTYTFGRTASASVIAYQSFDRVKAMGNQTYVNQAQVTPASLTTQTATNAQALVVGTSAITVATLNDTVTDGLNTATWIANSMADADQESFFISTTDIAQTATTNLRSLLTANRNVELAYTPPGGVSTSEWVSVEGVTVRGFIDRTEVDFNLASFTYYRVFILNNAVNGVLDESRLGY